MWKGISVGDENKISIESNPHELIGNHLELIRKLSDCRQNLSSGEKKDKDVFEIISHVTDLLKFCNHYKFLQKNVVKDIKE